MKRYVFCMTPGRSGTHYLTELLKVNLPEAEVHHEILGFDKFGVDSPDISHMTLFNSVGNVDKVRGFWEQKLKRIAARPVECYVETSHLLMKAGLVENLDCLRGTGDVHFVCLHRDIVLTIFSYLRNSLFANKIMWWSQFLDPAYPRKMVNPQPMEKFGLVGVCLWYVYEVMARTAYYRLSLAGSADVHFHEVALADLGSKSGATGLLRAIGQARAAAQVTVPPGQNVTVASERELLASPDAQRLREIIESLPFDAEALARQHLESGGRA